MKTNNYSKNEIKGFNLDKDVKVVDLIDHFASMGLQASHLGDSIRILKKMKEDKATIFLSFTSNMVSSGLREIFAQLCKEKLIDAIITGAGSIEEDAIKCKMPFLLGDFNMDDLELHQEGINRIGNILVPSDRYEYLEDFMMPILAELFEEQKNTSKMCSPSKLANKIGTKLNDENSFLYWAAKNNIPVYCPAITDGALGLNIYFFKQKNLEFGIDTTGDMKKLADQVLLAEKTAGIILGGGFAKHHLIGVNILREGLDYAIYVTTALEGDGSLSGARPKEAKSWSKIKEDANSVCIEGDASIIFPLIAITMKNIFEEKHE